MQRPNPARVVTLTTDFGLADAYVAAMKAAILRECPGALLIDVTHQVPRHDVAAGSIALERAWHAFATGFDRVVHLCVVDPGVGTERRVIASEVGNALLVCPDNGLATWTLARHAPAAGRTWSFGHAFPGASFVFHGRDVMAPLAGRLARGEAPATLGAQPIGNPLMLDLHPASPGTRTGRVIHLDAFGNCTTNLPRENIDRARAVSAGGRTLPISRTYADVSPGEPLALIGSSDLLEIAVRQGSAAEALGLSVGSDVELLEHD